MSIQAITAVIDSRLYKDAEYAVLLALANYADAGGYCYPSYRTLALDSRKGVSTVKRAIANLLPAKGASLEEAARAPLTIERRGGGPGRSNYYRLNVELFEDARDRMRAAKKRAKAQGSRGETVPKLDSLPSQSGEMSLTHDPHKGLNSGHKPVTEPFKEPDAHAMRPRASDLGVDDWSAARKAFKESFGASAFANRLARMAFADGLIRAPTLADAQVLAVHHGEWLSGRGFTGIITIDGEGISL